VWHPIVSAKGPPIDPQSTPSTQFRLSPPASKLHYRWRDTEVLPSTPDTWQRCEVHEAVTRPFEMQRVRQLPHCRAQVMGTNFNRLSRWLTRCNLKDNEWRQAVGDALAHVAHVQGLEHCQSSARHSTCIMRPLHWLNLGVSLDPRPRFQTNRGRSKHADLDSAQSP
jgi:hypothetical protein